MFESLCTVSCFRSIATLAISVTFSIKWWRYLEILVRCHSESSEIAPFNRSHTSSYWRMALSSILSEIRQDVGRKSRFFHAPCIQRPHYGGFHWTIAIMNVWCGKTRMVCVTYICRLIWRRHQLEYWLTPHCGSQLAKHVTGVTPVPGRRAVWLGDDWLCCRGSARAWRAVC